MAYVEDPTVKKRTEKLLELLENNSQILERLLKVLSLSQEEFDKRVRDSLKRIK